MVSLRSTVAGVREVARRSDLLLVAAALTTYAAFGFVPLVAIGARVAAGVLGAGRVVRTAHGVARFVPGPLGLDHGVVAFARAASHASWWTVLLALLPASLYAEGLVRCLERFSMVPERRPRAVRGRVFTALLVAFSTGGMLLLVGVVRPLFFDPFGRGVGPRLLGVFVAFNILFAVFLVGLGTVYRLFATTPIRPFALLLGAGGAASWLASQSLAYLIVLRSVGGFARAYGNDVPVGAVAAIGFLVYLNHVVALGGYALALHLHEARTADDPATPA